MSSWILGSVVLWICWIKGLTQREGLPIITTLSSQGGAEGQEAHPDSGLVENLDQERRSTTFAAATAKPQAKLGYLSNPRDISHERLT
ncbi:jg9867 [Pararge aegeria aegeria]|uniref:Jg9867 protein n=1 Tax=Pararge aegeria aegeria TaxID=348720 RepID=A0A8S4RJ87_9NEOP|nr:jg9867 [Pararge aegeria aegeria]